MIKLNKSINQSKKSCLRIPGLYHYSHSFSGVRVAQSLVFCIVFLRSSFVCVLFLFTIVFWLTFFNLQILQTFHIVLQKFTNSTCFYYRIELHLLALYTKLHFCHIFTQNIHILIQFPHSPQNYICKHFTQNYTFVTFLHKIYIFEFEFIIWISNKQLYLS